MFDSIRYDMIWDATIFPGKSSRHIFLESGNPEYPSISKIPGTYQDKDTEEVQISTINGGFSIGINDEVSTIQNLHTLR